MAATKILELEKLHGRAALTRFDDIGAEERLVEVVTGETTRLIMTCKSGLDELGVVGGVDEAPAERRMRENAKRNMALRLQELVVRHRSAQKRYLQRLKAKQGAVGGASAVFSFMDEEMRGKGSKGGGLSAGAGGADVDLGFNPQQLQQLQRSEVRFYIHERSLRRKSELQTDRNSTTGNRTNLLTSPVSLFFFSSLLLRRLLSRAYVPCIDINPVGSSLYIKAHADIREREVMSIMQSVNDLLEVMRDLSVLVIDQGTMLDRIDANVESAMVEVQRGVLELDRAERTQKSSRNWLIISVLLTMIMILMLVVGMKYI